MATTSALPWSRLQFQSITDGDDLSVTMLLSGDESLTLQEWVRFDDGTLHPESSAFQLTESIDNPGDDLTLWTDGTDLFFGDVQVTGGGGAGTVTSVGLTVPSFLSVAGSPVTTSGTLAVSLATQSANTVFAGPTSGGAVAPGFRALVANDIPWSAPGAIGSVTPAAGTFTTLSCTGVLSGFLAGVVIDATDTITLSSATHQGRILRCTSGSAVDITVPDTLPIGFTVTIIQDGAGTLHIVAGGGATVNNRQGHAHSAGQYAMLSLAVMTNVGDTAAVAVLGGDTAT